MGILVDQRPRLLEGPLRLVVAPHRLVRARQHHPALIVLRFPFELRRQAGDHVFDVLAAEIAAGHLVQRRRVAQPGVEPRREQGYGDDHDDQGRPPKRRRRQRHIGFGGVFQQAALNLAARLLVVGLSELAGTAVPFQLA